jgi:hypothetical protein
VSEFFLYIRFDQRNTRHANGCLPSLIWYECLVLALYLVSDTDAAFSVRNMYKLCSWGGVEHEVPLQPGNAQPRKMGSYSFFIMDITHRKQLHPTA